MIAGANHSEPPQANAGGNLWISLGVKPHRQFEPTPGTHLLSASGEKFELLNEMGSHFSLTPARLTVYDCALGGKWGLHKSGCGARFW